MTGGELQGEKRAGWDNGEGEQQRLPTKQLQISSVKAFSMDFNMGRENMGLYIFLNTYIYAR